MWKHFGRFGRVTDVFIPSKKTREGKRFGFVRFKGVTDAEKVAREVRGVAVGPNLITFNVVKFGREEKRMAEKPQYKEEAHAYHISHA